MAEIVEETIEETFLKYRKDISGKMTDENSVVQSQINTMERQFREFGLTKEQLTKIIAEISVTAIKYIDSDANRTAIALLEIEQKAPLIEAQIKLAETQAEIALQELEIKKQELLIKEKELELKDKELALMDKELQLKDKELLMMAEEIKLKQQQVKESAAKVKLIEAQVVTEGKQQGMITAQTALVARQTRGYGDNLLIKAAEFQGGLASFAVNAGSDTAGTAIKNFSDTISQIKQRAL